MAETLLVRIVADSGKLKAGLAGAQGSLKTFSNRASLISIPLAAGLNKATDAASDLAESASKVGVVFGEQAGRIQAWAQTADRAMGQSEQAALEAAGTFGNLFRAMDIGLGPATKMATAFVQLASDLASFNNQNPEDVLIALRAGVVGEVEPLRRFGVSLSAARVEAEALTLGLAAAPRNLARVQAAQVAVERSTLALARAQKSHGSESLEAREASAKVAVASDRLAKAMAGEKVTLTAAQKAQAAYSVIMKDTALAQGDFKRTADNAANSQRILAATAANAAAQLGNQLLPVKQDLIRAGIELANAYKRLSPEMQQVVAKSLLVGAAAGPVLRATVGIAGGVGAMTRSFSTGRSALKSGSDALGTLGRITAGLRMAPLLGLGVVVAGLAGKYFLFRNRTADSETALRNWRSAVDAAKGAADNLARAKLTEAQAALDLKAAQQQEAFARAEVKRLQDEGITKGPQMASARLAEETAIIAVANAEMNLKDARAASTRAAETDLAAQEKAAARRAEIAESLMRESARAFKTLLAEQKTGLDTGARRVAAYSEIITERMGKALRDRAVEAEDVARALRDLPEEVRFAVEAKIAAQLRINVQLRGFPAHTAIRERASGGPIVPGVPYIVGERGPEVREFSRGGRIVPNHQLRSGRRAGVAAGRPIVFNIYGGDARTTAREVARILGREADLIQRAG